MIRGRLLVCGAMMVTLAAAIAVSAADSAKKAAAPAPKKPWLTPLDPAVKKLPFDSLAIPADESRKLIHVPEGYEVELVASEPMVVDPVAINWGPDGRIWVVEMADYPLGIDNHGKSGSRVRYLMDTDGDGKVDKSVLFAEGLNFANSIMPWHKGVLVTCAPEIIYLEDTDGDGKADVRKTLYSGFEEGNPQLRINGLRPGLDNWLYCANGLHSRGPVKSATTSDTIPDLSGLDFRIRPDSGNIAAQAGATEFGRVMDNDGNWFGSDNSNPLWHFALAEQYIRRNPHIAFPDSRVQLVTPRNCPIYPVSKLQQRFNVDYMANRITSACGAEVYRDEVLFPAGTMNGLTCEPVHNMVLRTVIEPAGVTFSGHRAPTEQRSEFIASEDRWFRPVMTRTGPDGGLWVCDFYRYTVEHPAYMTEEWRSKLEIRAGDDKGRIYRLVPKGKKLPLTTRFDNLDGPGLVAKLDSTNGWTRELVQQMLIWAGDKAAVAPLESLVKTSKNPHARLHALCTLDGLNALSDDVLEAAMHDGYPAIRANAVRIAEPRGDKSPRLIDAAVKLTDDPDAKVRMQLACSLGEWSSATAGEALGRMAVRDGEDDYIVAGVMSSAVKHHAAIVSTVLKAGKASGDMVNNLLEMSAALKDRHAAAQLLDRVLTPASGTFAGWQLEAFSGWIVTLPKQKTTLAKLAADGDELSKQIARTPEVFAAARQIVADGQRATPDRLAAARLLVREAGHEDEDVKVATALFTPQTPSSVQVAAVTAITRNPKVNLPDVLLANWEGYGPDVRLAVTEALLRKDDTTIELLQRAADKKLVGFDVEFTRRARLLKHKNPKIADLAKQALGTSSSEARAKIVADYKQAIEPLKGDSARGAAVFARVCAICHRIGDVGKDIGPDLRSVTDRSADGLVTAIMDPNHDIDPKFYAYLATLGTGEVLMGVLTNETGNSVTILGMDGNPRTVLRKDLSSLKNTGRSLMIEGLEAAVSKQDMADLVRYLGYPD